MEKFGIEINSKQRKFELIKNIPLDLIQRQLVFGTLLGDGCIAPHGRKNKSYRLLIGHCEAQKELVLWKKQILNDYVNVIKKNIDKRGNSIMYSFSTITHNDFKYFYDLFYENGRKVIREEMVQYLTPLALAVWIIDDGSRYQMKNIMRIATDSFTKSENELLQYFFKNNFDLQAEVRGYIRNNRQFHYLSFNVKNSILLSDIIRPYIINSMKYKIGER
ncbi:MAG: hypothetical protein WC758_08620 [Candidatus Woesearchaeota archaeon]